MGILPFNNFGVQGNIAGIHPGLLLGGLGNSGIINPALAAANPALANPLLANSVLTNAALGQTGIINPSLLNPFAAASVNPALATAAGVNPLVAQAGLVAANQVLAQSGVVNPLLNQGLVRPDIWQLGLPQLGLNHHRLLRPHHAHPGLLHPAAHHSGFAGPGYGYPFGGGIPPVGEHGHREIVHDHPHVHDSGPFEQHEHYEPPQEILHDHPHDHGYEEHHEPVYDHPHHLPVHPDDLDFIEMNDDAPFQEPSCSRDSSKTWCTEDERYPKNQIELAGHLHAEGLMDLYADVSDLDTELSVKGHSFIYDESYLCQSDTSYIRPLRALNTQGKWRVIVNNVKIHYQKLTQTVRIEECLAHGEQCPLIPHCYPSKCLQKLIYHKFLVFDPYDHAFPFAIDTFKLPASCACKIDKFIIKGYR